MLTAADLLAAFRETFGLSIVVPSQSVRLKCGLSKSIGEITATIDAWFAAKTRSKTIPGIEQADLVNPTGMLQFLPLLLDGRLPHAAWDAMGVRITEEEVESTGLLIRRT
jgi:hypothetical protein